MSHFSLRLLVLFVISSTPKSFAQNLNQGSQRLDPSVEKSILVQAKEEAQKDLEQVSTDYKIEKNKIEKILENL